MSSLFSPAAIGPVWPAMLVFAAYMLTTSAFIVLAYMRSLFQRFGLREIRFLHRIYDATETISTLAILCGMIGTCLGLLEVLPVLGESLRQSGNQDVLQQVLVPLRNVWVSTIAGLIIGGLWGESLLFILKPYTRPALLPLSIDEPPEQGMTFPEPGNPVPQPPAAEDQDFASDWREQDKEGIY